MPDQPIPQEPLTWDGMRDALSRLSDHVGFQAGLPMPLQGMTLTIHPKFPAKRFFDQLAKDEEAKQPPEPHWSDDYEVKNRWWSSRLRATCVILKHKETGALKPAIQGSGNSLRMQLDTMDASVAWGFEQEAAALELLANLTDETKIKRWMMSGMFMERSQRSGVYYLFRRLRPTLAMSVQGGDMKIIAALCMHPIAYYEGSFAGAMCPTDDVIAHLMLMRGDEHRFWKVCNQHHRFSAQASLMG